MSTLEEIQETFKGLSPAETTQAVQQLRWILDSLPADGESAADARLRLDLGLFITGYEIGAQQAAGRGAR